MEKHKEIVTWEQLRQELCSQDTFVEFENSLRVAIGKIREALNNDAENPRFVANVPRIGYSLSCAGQCRGTSFDKAYRTYGEV